MWRLYDNHYDNVDRATFDHDLAEKQEVFLAHDMSSGEVVGFSTAVIYRHPYRGRTVGVYFSGDTVIHPRYWGQRVLHNTVMRSLVAWKLRHPGTPLYWYLICSGYRTYLTMVRNFPNHWPHHLRDTPDWEAGLLDSIGRQRYPNAWDRERGVISLGPVQPVVKQRVAPLTSDVIELPEVKFFVQANPGHATGDELAMIGRLDLAAVGTVARKVLRRRSRGTPPRPVGAVRPYASEG
jgi:hypothetical protein